MEQNAALTMIKNRINIDIKNCTVQIENESAKRDALERKMNEMQSIIDQMVKDIQNVSSVSCICVYKCICFSRAVFLVQSQ